MRAVMLWSWLRWLFIAGKIKKFPVPIISWLFLAVEVPRWLGILSYPLKQALLCAYVAAFTMAAALALCGAVSVLDDKTMVFEPIRKAKNAVREFCSLLGQYLRAKHDRICPEITFAEAGQ
jgi:hypothetical protein